MQEFTKKYSRPQSKTKSWRTNKSKKKKKCTKPASRERMSWWINVDKIDEMDEMYPHHRNPVSQEPQGFKYDEMIKVIDTSKSGSQPRSDRDIINILDNKSGRNGAFKRLQSVEKRLQGVEPLNAT